MAGKVYYSPFIPAYSPSGVPLPGAFLYFYHTGTLTPAPIYSDGALTTPLDNPVESDGSARFPDIYLDDSITYRVRQLGPDGTQLGDDIDPYIPGTGLIGAQGPQGDQGEPGTNGVNGGVGSSAGFASLFSAANGMTIGTGITRVYLAGYSVSGVGAGWYDYDATVNGAYVTAHPRVSFIAADGRGFRLSQNQRLTLEQFGGKADSSLPSFDYVGGGYTNSAAASTGVTDNLAPLLAAISYTGLFGLSVSNGTGGMQPIHHENNDDTKTYYFSGTIVAPNSFHLQGTHSGSDGGPVGTSYRFPPNTGGIYCNHESTQPGAVIVDGRWTTYGTNGSIIAGISFWGGGGTNRTKHGCFHNTWIELRNCSFFQFPGNNIHNVGSVSAGVGNAGYGQTSGSLYTRVYCYGAGNWNTWVDGGDVSASTFIDLHHRHSRLGGLKDTGYFNNQYVGYQNNGHGSGYKGACWYSGRNYALITDTTGAGASTTPGTNDNIWHDQGAAGSATTNYPAWSALATYELSLPVYCTGLGTVVWGYQENYYLPSHFGLSALCGNTQMYCTRTSNMFGAGLNGGGTASVGSHRAIKQFSPDSATVGNEMISTLGGSDLAIWGHGRANEGALEYQHSYLTGGVLFNYGGATSGYAPIYFYSTLNSDKNFGRTAPVTHVFEPQRLSIGDDSGDVGTGRIVTTGTAAPTTGLHAQGEIVFNKAPAASGTFAWVCVTAGTPGTWKAVSGIAA